MGPDSETIVTAFFERVQDTPAKVALRWLNTKGVEVENLTYEDLWSRICGVARLLRDVHGVGEGDRVFLLYPPGLAFVVALMGTLLANAVPVAQYPPTPQNYLAAITRLTALYEFVKPKVTLTAQEYARVRKAIALQHLSKHPRKHKSLPSSIRWVVSDTKAVLKSVCDTETVTTLLTEHRRVAKPTALAFIQFSSGTTGLPKGVCVSHDNLLTNIRSLVHCNGHSSSDIGVQWLPHAHDFSLVAGIFQPLYLGCEAVLMSPITFLRNPYIWLKAVSDYKANVTGAPSFAYGYAAKKVTPEQVSGLDLSRCIFGNGGEYISARALTEFADHFAAAGYRPGQMAPALGMAEHVLHVSGWGVDRTAPRVLYLKGSTLRSGHAIELQGDADIAAKAVVSLGRPAFQTDIVAVHDRRLLPDSTVGELWVHSKSIASGYLERPNLTEEIFNNYLESDETRSTKYLATGDLGFILDGEVFVCGRLKDMIICKGKNYFVQDIAETVAQADKSVRPGCVAVFSVLEDAEEKLVIVAEVRDSALKSKDLRILCRTIMHTVTDLNEVLPWAVAVCPEKVLEKTTSGKLKHLHTKELFLASRGELKLRHTEYSTTNEPAFTRSQPTTFSPLADVQLEQVVNEAIVAVLGDAVDPQTHGMTSLQGVELVSHLEDALGIHLPENFLGECTSTADMVRFLENFLPSASTRPRPPSRDIKKIQENSGQPLNCIALALVQTVTVLWLFLSVAVSVLPVYALFDRVVFTSQVPQPWSGFLLANVPQYGLLAGLAVPLWALTYSFLTLLIKWVVIGTYVEHNGHINSWGYLRCALVDRQVAFWELWVGDFVSGTIFQWMFLRLAGCKVALSASVGSVREFDLVTIGPGASVSTPLRPFGFLQGRKYTLRAIHVGTDAIVEVGSHIEPGCLVADSAVVESGCCLPSDSVTQSWAHYRHNPALEYVTPVPEDRCQATPRALDTLIKHICKAFCLFVASQALFQSSTMSSLLLWDAIGFFDFRYLPLLVWITSVFLGGLIATIVTVLLKWILLGHVSPGVEQASIARSVSRWLVDWMYHLAYRLFMSWMEETVVPVLWIQAFGAKVGLSSRFVSLLPTVTASDADLVEVGEDVLISTSKLIVRSSEPGGEETKSKVTIGCGSVIGITAVVGPAATVGKKCVVGAGAVLRDADLFDGSVMLGRTHIRPQSSDRSRSIHSSWFQETFVLLFRVLTLAWFMVLLTPSYELTSWLYFGTDAQTRLLGSKQNPPVDSLFATILLPAVFICASLSITFGFIVLERIIVGWRFRRAKSPWLPLYPTSQVIVYFRSLYSLSILLEGTIWFNLWLRLQGAKVALNAIVLSSLAYDLPLATIGQNAIISRNCRMIGHRVDLDIVFDGAIVEDDTLVQPGCVLWAGDHVQGVVPALTLPRGSNETKPKGSCVEFTL